MVCFVVFLLAGCVTAAILQDDFATCERSKEMVNSSFCLGFASGAGMENWGNRCDDLQSNHSRVACLEAQQLEFVVHRVSTTNLVDLVLEIVIAVGFFAAPLVYVVPLTSVAEASGLFVSAASLATIVMQIVVIVDAFKVNQLLVDLQAAGCWNYAGSIIVNEVADSFKAIRHVGILELCLGVLQLMLSVKQIVGAVDSADNNAKFDYAEFSLGVLLTAIDVALASVDYGVFTIDLDQKARKLLDSMQLADHIEVVPCAFSPPIQATSAAFLCRPSMLLVACCLASYSMLGRH